MQCNEQLSAKNDNVPMQTGARGRMRGEEEEEEERGGESTSSGPAYLVLPARHRAS